MCWNWQTRRTQNPLVAIPCGFDPRHRQKEMEPSRGSISFCRYRVRETRFDAPDELTISSIYTRFALLRRSLRRRTQWVRPPRKCSHSPHHVRLTPLLRRSVAQTNAVGSTPTKMFALSLSRAADSPTPLSGSFSFCRYRVRRTRCEPLAV